jgi:predicted O-methyltransferase YrrM
MNATKDAKVDFSFCLKLEEMIRTGVAVGRSGKRFENIGALSTSNNLNVLRQLMLRYKPKRTLEIGLCFGGSCLLLAATHRELTGQASKQHTAVDPFQQQVWDDAGLLALERAELAGYVSFQPSFSSIILPRLLEENEQFDLVYIDGSHLFEDVFIDTYYTGRLLSDGGVVAFDDCGDPHVRKVLAFLCSNLGDSFQELDLRPFRTDQGRSTKYRLARLLGRTQMRAFRRVGAATRPWNAPFHSF